MAIRVECYAGHRGEEAPRRILLDGRRLEVVVMRTWLEPDCRCFEAECSDGRRYFLRHSEAADEWRVES